MFRYFKDRTSVLFQRFKSFKLRQHIALFALISLGGYVIIDVLNVQPISSQQIPKLSPFRLGNDFVFNSALLNVRSLKPIRFELLKQVQPPSSFFDSKNNTTGECANHSFVSHDDTELAIDPSDESETIKDITGEPFYIDSRFDLKIIDEKVDWVHVKAISPRWPKENLRLHGWIKKSILNNSKPINYGYGCLYFNFANWIGINDEHKLEAEMYSKKILNTDKRCTRIVNAGFIGDGQRYFVTCYPSDGGKAYHYWSSLMSSDQAISKKLDFVETQIFGLCKQELIRVSTNLSKIRHSRSGDVYDEFNFGEDLKIISTETFSENSIWKATIHYSLAVGDDLVSYCYIDPMGKAEITFPPIVNE